MIIKIEEQKFEGPLFLLLKMIEDRELDITQINLAKIAEKYGKYIEEEKDNIDSNIIANFLVVAAKLLLIKSRALLPYLHTEEDEEEIDNFEKQIKIYKEFLNASENIKSILEKGDFMFSKNFNKKDISLSIKFSPPEKINQNIIFQTFLEFLRRIKPKEEKFQEEKIQIRVSVEEKISQIKEKLQKLKKFNFNEIVSFQEKNEVIVSFLAILELAKQKQISIKQNDIFANILINKN